MRPIVNTSRRICNLTAEEVDKKRAIDRDNQRHHRAKTKAFVRSLEQKVAELTTRLRETEDLLEQYQQREANAHQPAVSLSHPPATLPTCAEQVAMEASAQIPLLCDDSIKSYLDSLPLDLGTGMTIHSFNAPQDCNFLDWDLTGVCDNLSPTAEAIPNVATNNTAAESWDGVGSQDQMPEWQILPLYLPSTTKLDEVIITTTAAWRSRSLQHDELNKTVFPSISSLLDRPNHVDQGLPSSFSETVAAQVWRSPLKGLAERIGFMYTLSHLIRWLVCRSKDTYEKMPAFLRPTKLQRTVPHAAWISTIPWPEARDALIKHMDLTGMIAAIWRLRLLAVTWGCYSVDEMSWWDAEAVMDEDFKMVELAQDIDGAEAGYVQERLTMSSGEA
ncbi:bzip transcription factor [Fusarium albosuccineum]|uniref:Bzip transcription factor n=1 Tax=Fusarium albosuccineum TaxID=1237068 RepID=A0A8H4LRI9_9HYPO|nr:bzip transcription factor [Fusarium albosuccineum]